MFLTKHSYPAAGLKNNQGNTITDASGNPADPFQFGGGHFRPSKAADPGLVYDASYTDYLLYLCSTGVKINSSFTCPEHSWAPANLNYPSLAIPGLNNNSVTVVRTVTNVGGSGKSTYFVRVKPPVGISVKIWPPILYFKHVGQRRSFTITVKAAGSVQKSKYGFGWYTWSDGIHIVRSSMAVSVA